MMLASFLKIMQCLVTLTLFQHLVLLNQLLKSLIYYFPIQYFILIKLNIYYLYERMMEAILCIVLSLHLPFLFAW
jgi:flagellar biosynthesis protein FliR